MSDYTPREIVAELDRYIVGQAKAKRAVAIALRNRWRRRRVAAPLDEEITPKNILMAGPTGVGKTEISRRLAKLAEAPFIKVEATKFTEVGYVGRDVESMIRDLVEVAVTLLRDKRREAVRASAERAAEDRVLDALVGESGGEAARERFRRMLRDGELDDREVELQLREAPSTPPMFELPGAPGASMGMINLSDMFGKAFQGQGRKRRVRIVDAHAPLIAEESDKLVDEDALARDALELAQNDGIVFLDEIDKIARGAERQGADVSREGVQRDLLPLIEGSTVSTKYGAIKTDHILFIASGAFHTSKPSDLLPELQGRLPIRVELDALGRDDLRRILVEPEASLIRQYTALMETEGVTLDFTDDALDALADAAALVNSGVENIGARRLATIMETMLDDVSFSAADRDGETVRIDAAYVKSRLDDITSNTDLSKYIL